MRSLAITAFWMGAALLSALSCVREEFSERQEDPARQERISEIGKVRGVAVVRVSEELAAQLEEAAAADLTSGTQYSAGAQLARSEPESRSSAGALLTRSAPFNGVLDELQVRSWSRVFPDAGEFEERTREAGLHRWYRIEYADSIPATRASVSLKGVEGIQKVSRAHKVHRTATAATIPDDPQFRWQWDIYNDKSLNLDVTARYQGKNYSLSSNAGADINVLPVWEKYTVGSSKIIVAVVDEGVDASHPDLKNVVIPAGENGSKNFVNLRTPYKITPGSHGTHVAGTIAAVRNNKTGVAGIAGGDFAKGIQGVRILSCEIFDGDDSCSDDQCAAAIKWGADHGAVISQNSWGNYYDDNDDGVIDAEELAAAKADRIPDYLADAIDYFITRAGCDKNHNQLADSPMRGGVVIFAAGNDGIQYGVPADYENVIAVGASQADYDVTWYSNYGSWVDICAPGGDGYGVYADNEITYNVTSADGIGNSRGNIWNLYATVKGSEDEYVNYGYMKGTSMACPHVSGVAALLVSYFGRYGFTAAKLKERLLGGADNSYINNRYYVGPHLNAMGAFCYGNTPPELKKDFSDYVFALVGDRASFDLNEIFYDPDGDALTYAVAVTGDVVSANVTGTTLNVNAIGKGYGTLTVTASDQDISISSTMNITVKRRDENDEDISKSDPVALEGGIISTMMRVSALDAKAISVKVSNATGRKVAEQSGVASFATPLNIDMSKFAPGRYGVSIVYEGKTYKYTVVKK